MASIIAKKKANQLYYYVVDSARVDGKPRIVHQTYLGTAEKVAALVKDRTAPVPLEARRSMLVWPVRYGSPLFGPGSLNSSSLFGRNPARVRRPRIFCCWPRSTASVNRVLKPK